MDAGGGCKSETASGRPEKQDSGKGITVFAPEYRVFRKGYFSGNAEKTEKVCK